MLRAYNLLTLKCKYKKLTLTKIWGQFDPKTCLHLTKEYVSLIVGLYKNNGLQKASIYEALGVKLPQIFV